MALEGIRRFEKFLSEIGMPTNLSQLDIPDDRFNEMAKKCVEFGPVGIL
ncbi:hypothetical protein MKY30_04965 [Oceanobacillus sp. FSL W8-0428]